MTTLHQTVITLLCTLLGVAVVMHGAHAKDLSTQPSPTIAQDKKTISDDQPFAHKVAPELHNHVDKQLGKTFHAQGDLQADNRSLRILHHQRKDSLYVERLLNKLRNLWHMSV